MVVRCGDRLQILLPARFSGYTGTYSGNGSVVDLSLYGCRLQAEESTIPPGTIVMLQISLSHERDLTVDAAVIRWQRERTYGLKFCFLQSEQRTRLQHYLTAPR
jgi:hypothetical protein